MASPQKEHGYTAIANEIIEALARTRIPGESRQVLDVVIRLTYGWNRKARHITYREFTERTGLQARHVFRALRSLQAHGLVERTADGYRLQKDYEKWLPYSKNGVPKKGADTTPKVEQSDTPILEQSPTPEMEHETGRNSNNGNGYQTPKDSIKDNLKTSLSHDQSLPNLEEEREKLEKRVKRLFPQCVSIPKGIPTEKLFLFVYRISRGEIKAESIGSPVAYMKGMLAEDVAPLLEKIQQDARAKAANAEKARQEREALEKQREENGAEMAQLIKDFLAQMEGKHAVGV